MTNNDANLITFACGGCGRPFAVPRSFAGRKATCKTCGTRVVVPGGADAPQATGGAEMSAAAPLVEAPARRVGSVTSAGDAANASEGHVGVISEAQAPPTTAVETPDSPAVAPAPAPFASANLAERPAAPGKGPPKTPVRIRRMMVDAEQMASTFSGDGPIRVKSAVGDPPEIYQVEYQIKSLQKGWLGKPKSRNEHLVEIQLTSDYPRLSPKCRMLTPVFHPNIDETTICVGDHWTAGARLVDLVIQIGEMLAYQAYNIKSPLNGEAAMWADLNPGKLPTDSRNLHPGEE